MFSGLWQVVVRHLRLITCCFLPSLFLLSCAAEPAQTPQTITAYSTSSARPWMNDLFACADETAVTVKVTAQEPDIFIRIGEPDVLPDTVYYIGEEEIFIVTNRESPLGNLSQQEAQALFAGLGDPSVQVWVYPSDLEMQGLFDQFVMQGRSVAPSARVAVNPGQVSDLLNAGSNVVGFLPARWKVGNIREVYSLGVFPVLAVVGAEPKGGVMAVLACMQGN